MARRRKTADELSQERYEAEQRAWDVFRPKLAALQTFDEAVSLVNQAPPHSSPARRHYSNLGFFLQNNFNVPAGSSNAERALYLEFITRLDAAGALKPDAREQIERTIRASITGWN
jgi:hypothetical protein